ncbi:MAG: HEAT repeat domain-containing protein [Methanomicrobiales archaeon]|nr:HEAT repeat domain-containing protein [Methanomicrobiales archaeon]
MRFFDLFRGTIRIEVIDGADDQRQEGAFRSGMQAPEKERAPAPAAPANVPGIAEDGISIAGPRIIEPMIAASQHASPEIRRRAVACLARIDSPSTYAPLIAALSDADAKVRSIAAKNLGEKGCFPAVQPLLRTVCDPDPEVRQHAVLSLEMLADRRAVGEFMQHFPIPTRKYASTRSLSSRKSGMHVPWSRCCTPSGMIPRTGSSPPWCCWGLPTPR